MDIESPGIWQKRVRVLACSSGVDLRALEPGRDLVIQAPRGQDETLPHGLLLDDWLPVDVRASIDLEATARLAAWRERRDAALTVDGVCLSQIWEVELLADVFVAETRVVSGLQAVLAGGQIAHLELVGLDARRVACIRATLESFGIESHSTGGVVTRPRVETSKSAPDRQALSRRLGRRILATTGLPPFVRGEVYFLPYWHLATGFRRLLVTPDLRPVLDPSSLPDVPVFTLLRAAARGGWVGYPGAAARRRSRRETAACLAAVGRANPGNDDPLGRLLDERAIALLAQRAGDTFAIVASLRHSLASKSMRVAVLPFDSPPEARSIVAAAHHASVKTLVVQHGFVAEPDTGPEYTVADTIAVWAENDAVSLRERASGTIAVTGNPGVPGPADRRRMPPSSQALGRTIVLVEYSSRLSTRIDSMVSVRHVRAALRGLATARPGTVVTIRPHPSEHEPEIFAASALGHPELAVGIDIASSITELIASADLVVGAVSTATLQAAAVGVPVVFLNVSGSVPPWPFDGSTGVPIANSSEELAELIPQLLSAGNVPGRPEMLDALGVDVNAVDNVIDLIRALAATDLGNEPAARHELWLLDDGRTFGGGQMNVLRLGQFIASESPDWSVRVLCPLASELGKRCLAAGIPVSDAHFPDLSVTGVPRIARAVCSLRRYLAQADERVIVVGGSLRAQVYAHTAATRLKHKPAMVQFMTEQDSAGRWSAIHLLQRFGAVAAVGGNAARAYADALPKVDVIKVNNFLLPGEFANHPARHTESGRPPALGALARLIPEKGILELLDELAAIRPSWSKLLIGGNADDTAYLQRVEERIVALGLDESVSLLGHLDDTRAFLSEVDVLIVPSVGNEGQPTVILEALASDRPAIIRHHVWANDFDGLPVFPYRDASDLAHLLENLLEPTVDRVELERRFGPRQALEAFEAAADQTRTKRRVRR